MHYALCYDVHMTKLSLPLQTYVLLHYQTDTELNL